MSGPHIGTCKRCGKQTEYRYKCRIRDYCSHACSNAAKWDVRQRAETKTYTCLGCGNTFTRFSYQVSAREKAGAQIKYCSHPCATEHAAKTANRTLKCAQCGTEFSRKASRVGERAFCSRECFGASCRTEGTTWASTNPDISQRREYMRKYIASNRQRINARSRQWAEQNREYRRYLNTLRRASGRISVDDRRKAFEAASGKCQVCGETENLHVDHIVPVARGGRTEPGNLQLLCRFCNISKGAKPFAEWLPQRMKELGRAS